MRHLRVLPRREAVTAAWPDWAHPDVVSAFGARGVVELWRHQAVAAEATRRQQHVVVSTGTASGKSLAYQLPALTTILERRGTRGERGASTLYISPTKALAQDQLATIAGLGLDVRVTTQNVEVVSTDADRGLILIRGAVPGTKGAWILVRDAAKSALPANAPKPAALRAANKQAPANEGAE